MRLRKRRVQVPRNMVGRKKDQRWHTLDFLEAVHELIKNGEVRFEVGQLEELRVECNARIGDYIMRYGEGTRLKEGTGS